MADKKIEIEPFQGLKIIQTIKDLEDVNCQFNVGLEDPGPHLECQDCFSTNIIYKVIIEAEMSVGISNNVIEMDNEKVQAVGVARCYMCDGINIERVGYNAGLVKKGQPKRLVPRF